MAELRLMGKEVSLRLTRSGVFQREITAIKSLVFQFDIDEKEEGYLGETADRQDVNYKRVSGNFVVHHESPDSIDLMKAIADRAQRRIANDEVVTATFRAVFPDGRTRRVTIPDMKFGALGFNVGGRGDYVDTTFPYRAEQATVSK